MRQAQESGRGDVFVSSGKLAHRHGIRLDSVGIAGEAGSAGSFRLPTVIHAIAGALLSANLSGVLMNAGVVLVVSLGLGKFAIWAMGLVMLAGGFLLASYVLGRGRDVESGEILGFRRAMAVLAVGTVLPFLLLALVSVAGTFLTGGVSP